MPISVAGAELEKHFRRRPETYAANQSGCGSRRFSGALANYGCRVLALDFSWRMIRDIRHPRGRRDHFRPSFRGLYPGRLELTAL